MIVELRSGNEVLFKTCIAMKFVDDDDDDDDRLNLNFNVSIVYKIQHMHVLCRLGLYVFNLYTPVLHCSCFFGTINPHVHEFCV